MPSSGRSVVTIGAYDGVHIGHRQVIERVRSLAAQDGLKSVVVTFDRHPAVVVRPESAPLLLTDLALKLELLGATGVDEVEILRFDEQRAAETAEEFIRGVLVSQLEVATVVVGRNFHFGKARSGTVALLEEMGAELGYRVVPFDLVVDGSPVRPGVPSGVSGPDVVSSTRIRRHIAAGELEAAGRLLGRPHEVRGVTTETVDREAVAIAVPSEILLPPPGTYAGRLGDLADREDWQICEARLEGGPSESRRVVVTSEREIGPPGAAIRLVFDRPG